MSLNPHVVGKFFRAETIRFSLKLAEVLIPMWWGSFSETQMMIFHTPLKS